MNEKSVSLVHSDSSFLIAEKTKILGNTLFEEGKFLEAIEIYTEALTVYPEYVVAYYNRGNCKAKLKQYIEAISDYSEAIRLDPLFIDAYLNRGNCKTKLQLYIQAISDYSEIIYLDSHFALAYLNRGNCKAELEQHIEAIADYSESIHIDPFSAIAYTKRGDSKGELWQSTEAIIDYTEAIHLDPHYAPAYTNRGNRKTELKQYVEAIEDYSEAIRLVPKNGIAYVNRGNAYFAVDKHFEAIQDWCVAISKTMGLLSSKQNYAPIDEILKFRTINNNLLSSLKSCNLWFAHSHTFNDADDGEYLRKLFPENQSISDLLGKILMFSCFGNSFNSQNTQSQENEKQQMWAHYGAESAGVCLHFKYSPEAAQKGNLFMLDSVKYSDDIKFNENQSQYDVIRHGFFTKSTAWKSENEYRFITMASDKTVRSEDGHCIGQLVSEIDLGLTLSAVEFGARCSADDILKVKEALMQRGDSANIKLYQVKLGTADDPFRWSKEQII